MNHEQIRSSPSHGPFFPPGSSFEAFIRNHGRFLKNNYEQLPGMEKGSTLHDTAREAEQEAALHKRRHHFRRSR